MKFIMPQQFLESLSCKDLDDLHKRVSEVRYKKYPHSKHKSKYCNLNRAFSEQEKLKFLFAVDKSKFLAAFRLAFGLGLRASEIVLVNLNDFDFKHKQLKIHNIKSKKIDFMPLPNDLFEFLVSFIEQLRNKITDHNGFLVFSENPVNIFNDGHVSVNALQNIFRKYRELAGLNEVYAELPNPKGFGENQKLFRLSLHSCRHYAITRFYELSGHDLKLTKLFARHSKIDTTDLYIHLDTNKIRSVLNAKDVQMTLGF